MSPVMVAKAVTDPRRYCNDFGDDGDGDGDGDE